MSTVIEQRRGKAESPGRPLYRLTVPQYHAMFAQGILKATDRVELLDGYLVAKMTPNPPHAVAVSVITDLLAPLLPAGWVIRVQNPITLKESEPEPDLAVVRGPQRRYLTRHPGPRDVGLLIEVADSSLLDDRRYKTTLYAQSRIREVRIVNLVDDLVEVYTTPRGGRTPVYQGRKDYGRDDQVPFTVDGHLCGQLPVKDLLP